MNSCLSLSGAVITGVSLHAQIHTHTHTHTHTHRPRPSVCWNYRHAATDFIVDVTSQRGHYLSFTIVHYQFIIGSLPHFTDFLRKEEAF